MVMAFFLVLCFPYGLFHKTSRMLLALASQGCKYLEASGGMQIDMTCGYTLDQYIDSQYEAVNRLHNPYKYPMTAIA